MLLNLSGVQNFNTNFISTFFPSFRPLHSTHFLLSLSLYLSVCLCFCLSIRFLTVGENLWRGQSENCKTISAKTQNKKKGDDTKRQAGQKEEERGEEAQEDEEEEDGETPLRVNFSCSCSCICIYSCDCYCICICICGRLYLLSIRYR